MSNKDKIPSIAPLHYKYPSLSAEDMPDKFILFPITFRNEEIEEFEVLFFHRLLKRNYGFPSDWEPREIKREKIREGHYIIHALGKEWKYYIRTPSGGIIQIGTEKFHSLLKIFYVLPEDTSEPNEKQIKDGEKFVSDLLTEAVRLKGQILNPRKEFEEQEGLQLYLLENVFKRYYGSAELMLEDADEYENTILAEFRRYMPSVYHGEDVGGGVFRSIKDPEKDAYIDKHLVGLGMFYRSIVIHYFIALEGFVNLLYHAFLKKELKDQNLEQRLDIEMKLLFMPTLCNGFKTQLFDSKSEVFSDFKQLRNYRNEIFHSKITDSLKNVAFVQDGFLYQIDMEKGKKGSLFPSAANTLRNEDVLKVKGIVDKLIEEILNKMDDESSKLVKEFIMKAITLPFWRDDTGQIRFGKSGIEKSGST
jgi:hypothetical protein